MSCWKLSRHLQSLRCWAHSKRFVLPSQELYQRHFHMHNQILLPTLAFQAWRLRPVPNYLGLGTYEKQCSGLMSLQLVIEGSLSCCSLIEIICVT